MKLHQAIATALLLTAQLLPSMEAQLDPHCSGCPSGDCTYYKSLRCRCPSSGRVVEIGAKQDREYSQMSLGLVIDDTGSMSGVIESVKASIQGVVTETEGVFDNYVFGTFNDPYQFNLMESREAGTVYRFVSTIRAHDGGDCPEMTLSGIRDVAARVSVGSAVFVFTDASAKDLWLEPNVTAQLLEKDIRLNFIITGSLCDEGDLGSEFFRLADRTGGSIYWTSDQPDVQYVMNYIKKYARYGVRYIRGMPASLTDLKTVVTEICTCGTGAVHNLVCIAPTAGTSGSDL